MSPEQEYRTAKELNTKLAKRLKASFERAKKKKYAKLKKKQEKEKKKAKSSAKAAPHVDAAEMPTGVLAKDSMYATRGHAYIKANQTRGGDGRKGVYDEVKNRPHLKRIARLEEAEFPDGREQNFDPACTQSFPYTWEAHHMLPGSAFYYVGEGGPCFTGPQRGIILRSKYNVNDGHNIMMLPVENWAVPVHEVPQHPSDHVRYTQRVMGDLKKVSRNLQKLIDKGAPHDALQEDVYQQLRDKENSYWEFLARVGRDAISKVKEGTEFADDDGEYVDVGGKYKWGRLY